MHLNNGGINRPSLLSDSGARDTGSPAPGRILADIDGRSSPMSTSQNSYVNKNRRLLWTVFAIVSAITSAIVLAAVAIGDSDEEVRIYPPSSTNQEPAQLPFGGDAGTGAIVDTGTNVSGENIAPPILPSPANAAPSVAPPIATASTSDASASETSGTTIRSPAVINVSTAKVRNLKTKKPNASQKVDDDDLLRTLMGIIKEDEKNSPKHESMDSLIDKIRAEDQRNTAETNAAFDSIDKSKTRSRASTYSEIQVELRRCPNANTLKGIECRRKICKSLMGKDPACPAQ